MRKINILILSLCLILMFLSVNCSKSPTTPENQVLSEESNQTTSAINTRGFLQILMRDKPVDDAINIYVTINKIRVHQASPANFIVISEEEKEFDLLELKNNPQPIAEAELDEGHYNQIRMNVVSGRIVFEDGEYALEVPSNEIKIPVGFQIEEKGTVKIILDFDAKKSIKVIKAGKSDKYILRPVIKVVDVRYE